MSSRTIYVEAKNRKIIPQPRGHGATTTAIIFVIIIIILLYVFGIINYATDHILQSMAENFAILLACYGLKNFCNCFEEIRHVNTRYNGKYLKALEASFNLKIIWLIIPAFIIRYIIHTGELSQQFPAILTMLLHCLCYFLCYLFGIQSPVPATISEITEKRHLNVAHGLAWSYYVGYLQFVLPSIKKAIIKFNKENCNLLKFPESCILHILIPLSCKLYGDLSKIDNNITFEKELPPLLVDRAGIKQRVYKNNVYRILDEEHRPYYCIVEYATPLDSLYNMSYIASAAFSTEDRIQQAKLFYRTLKDILENSLECRDSYRLVVYDDSTSAGDDDVHVLSREILQHLKQEHSEEYALEYK